MSISRWNVDYAQIMAVFGIGMVFSVVAMYT
jgi:hypothetical protein